MPQDNSCQNLRGRSFKGQDLTEANFSYADIQGADFSEANLRGANFHQAKAGLKSYGIFVFSLFLFLIAGLSGFTAGIAITFATYFFLSLKPRIFTIFLASFFFICFIRTILNVTCGPIAVNVQLVAAVAIVLAVVAVGAPAAAVDEPEAKIGAMVVSGVMSMLFVLAVALNSVVRCEYVYMRLPTRENPDPLRKPDNNKEVFAPGEFGDFIKPIFDTLDLYHSQGIDPRAIAISFKQLAENHPEADLRIVGMEVRGEDKFLLRAKTAAMADKSELSAEYFDTYNQIKGLPEREIKLLLAEKDNQIRRLENMVMTALERPSFYSNVEQVGFMTNNPGGFSVGGSVDGDINNVQGENNQQKVSNKSSSFNLQGAQFAGGLVNADTVTANQIGGNITNYTTEQRQNLAEAAADIQQLLNQLGQTYPTNTPLEKQIAVTEALKQIDSNPTLKARVIGALKAGGTEAFKELVDNPLINILVATLEGWQDVE